MFERHSNLITVRSCMAAACLWLLAGCNEGDGSETPKAAAATAQANSSQSSSSQSSSSQSSSSQSSSSQITAPLAPTGLIATPGNTRANLTWSAISGATSYRVKRSTINGGPYTQVATPTSNSYSDISLFNGTPYYYVISAINSAGESANSSQVSTTPIAPTVGACDQLPAPGIWQDITPPGTSSKPAVNGTVATAIIVDPFDPKRVWLGTGTENDEIWRSDNCGSTWTRVNIGPGSVGDGKTYGGVGDGAQWSMQIDPVQPNTLYAVSGYGAESLWKTTDGGYSWTDILANSEYATVADYRFVNNVSLDPTDHLHLVVSTHGSCKAPYNPSCIAETKDGGATWKLLAAPESWVEGGGLILVKGGLWIWCGSTMMVTKDGGTSWSSNALAGGGSCEAEYTIRSFVPAANGKYYLGSRNGVLRSNDGETWEKVPNTYGFMVAIAQGSNDVFAADQWSPSIKRAKLNNDESWSALSTPPQISQGSDGGIPFVAYDDAHGILYTSMFSGGVARMVVP